MRGQACTASRAHHSHLLRTGSNPCHAQAMLSDCRTPQVSLHQAQALGKDKSVVEKQRQDMSTHNFVIVNNCLQTMSDGENRRVASDLCTQCFLDCDVGCVI